MYFKQTNRKKTEKQNVYFHVKMENSGWSFEKLSDARCLFWSDKLQLLNNCYQLIVFYYENMAQSQQSLLLFIPVWYLLVFTHLMSVFRLHCDSTNKQLIGSVGWSTVNTHALSHSYECRAVFLSRAHMNHCFRDPPLWGEIWTWMFVIWSYFNLLKGKKLNNACITCDVHVFSCTFVAEKDLIRVFFSLCLFPL